jgi:hypothetical protein
LVPIPNPSCCCWLQASRTQGSSMRFPCSPTASPCVAASSSLRHERLDCPLACKTFVRCERTRKTCPFSGGVLLEHCRRVRERSPSFVLVLRERPLFPYSRSPHKACESITTLQPSRRESLQRIHLKYPPFVHCLSHGATVHSRCCCANDSPLQGLCSVASVLRGSLSTDHR